MNQKTCQETVTQSSNVGRPLRVLMIVRKNLRRHPGGDTTQILQTADHLRRLGLAVDLLDTIPVTSADYDVIHLFHLDLLAAG